MALHEGVNIQFGLYMNKTSINEREGQTDRQTGRQTEKDRVYIYREREREMCARACVCVRVCARVCVCVCVRARARARVQARSRDKNEGPAGLFNYTEVETGSETK